jgi:hypothetical protein
MASKADTLKKRKVRKLKDMIDRKVDSGKGNPKTTNRVKTKTTVVKPKTKAGFLESGKNNMKTEFKDLKKEIKDIKEKKPKIKNPKTAAPEIKNLPVRIEQPNKPNKNPIGDFLEKTERNKKIRGNPNLAKTPDVIKQGYTPGSASRAVTPYSGASKTATSAIKEGLKFGSKILGAAAFIVDPSFMSTKTGGAAGEGSDKPTGPLMKGNSRSKIASRPEYPGSNVRKGGGAGSGDLAKAAGTLTKPYDVVNKAGGGPEKRQGSSSASMRLRSKIAGRPEYPGSNVRKARPSAAATATATAGTGTSTGATEKLSAFERMKARQYEREGYGGRVMTRKKATEQIMKERQYKSPLAGLFKRKGK